MGDGFGVGEVGQLGDASHTVWWLQPTVLHSLSGSSYHELLRNLLLCHHKTLIVVMVSECKVSRSLYWTP